MADERTPSDRASVLLRRRAERERLLKAARDEHREQVPSEWDDREEPSCKVTLSEPGQRLSVEGESADEVAKVLAAARQHKVPIFERVKHSVAPTVERMNTPKGKLGALITLIVSAIVAAVWTELAKRGVSGP